MNRVRVILHDTALILGCCTVVVIFVELIEFIVNWR